MRNGTTLNDFMQWDNTLFDNIVLPLGVNRETLISTIMLRCGLQNPLYEDYDVFKTQTEIWFQAHLWNFERAVRLINEEYNPLWNKDGTQTITRELNRTEDETTARDVSTDNTGMETNVESGSESNRMDYNSQAQEVMDDDTTFSETESGTNIHSVKGFNATDWQETDKDTSTKSRSGGGTDDRTTTTTNSGNDTGTKTFGKNDTLTLNTNVNTDDDTQRDLGVAESETITQRDFGNIGVTMSQDMFRSEAKLLREFNLYQWIAMYFDDEMMLGIYYY